MLVAFALEQRSLRIVGVGTNELAAHDQGVEIGQALTL